MYIDLAKDETTTVASSLYKEGYDEDVVYGILKHENTQNTTPSPYKTVKYEKTRRTSSTQSPFEKTRRTTSIPFRTTKNSLITYKPTYKYHLWTWQYLTAARGSSKDYIPITEIWPSLPTELTKTKPSNALYNGILGGVVVVVIAWAAAMAIAFRNKLQEKRQRRREALPPPYTNIESNTVPDSGFPGIGTNPQFGLPEQSEFNIAEVGTTADYSPSFISSQPSAQSFLPSTSSQDTNNEQPPSYAEIQQQRSNISIIPPSCEEQPPSYMEAQKQRIKVIGQHLNAAMTMIKNLPSIQPS